MSFSVLAPVPSHSSQIALRAIWNCTRRAETVSAPPSPGRRTEPAHSHGVPLVDRFELDLKLGDHVLAPPLLLLPAAKAKRAPEDVERVVEAAAALLLEPLLPVSVVRLALLSVAQDLVRVPDREELRRGRLVRVLVGV